MTFHPGTFRHASSKNKDSFLCSHNTINIHKKLKSLGIQITMHPSLKWVSHFHCFSNNRVGTCVKINKLHLQWIQEASRGSSHHYHPSPITDPHRKKCPSPTRTGRNWWNYWLLQQEEGRFPSLRATQPMTNHHHPERSLSSSGLSFKTISSHCLLFLYRVMFLSFACWTCLWFLL